MIILIITTKLLMMITINKKSDKNNVNENALHLACHYCHDNYPSY